MTPGALVTYRGRPAAVVAPPPPEQDLGHALVRFLDGDRERVLAWPHKLDAGEEG